MGSMENLAAAFAGESQANRKYLAFAAKADKAFYVGDRMTLAEGCVKGTIVRDA